MKANELRTGNLFMDKYSKQVIPVLEILRSGIIVFDFECMGIWQAEPIPITEKWLSKIKTTVAIKMSPNEGVVFFNSNYSHVIYVHQLQNLFFALTYEELIFN